MNRVASAVGAIAITSCLLAAGDAQAGSTPATTDEPQGGWSLISKGNWPKFDLDFDGSTEMSSTYSGYMAPGSIEALIAGGSFRLSGSSITFHTDRASDGWMWAWNTVTCDVAVSSELLVLSGCVGHGPKNGINMLPDAMPTASFSRLPR